MRRQAELEHQRQQHRSEVRLEVRKSLATKFVSADERRREQVIRESFFDLTGEEVNLQEAEPAAGEDRDLRFDIRKALREELSAQDVDAAEEAACKRHRAAEAESHARHGTGGTENGGETGETGGLLGIGEAARVAEGYA